mgnify:CR=1 FL=1
MRIIELFLKIIGKIFGGNKIMLYLCTRKTEETKFKRCPDGGIGRRAGLKHQWIHFHPGSTPGLGTKKAKFNLDFAFCFVLVTVILN